MSPAHSAEASALLRSAIEHSWRSQFSSAYVSACLDRARTTELVAHLAARQVLLALRESRIVGYAAREGAWLKGVFTHPDERRRGIGHALVSALQSSASAEAVTVLWLHAAPDAVPFYAALGFVTQHDLQRAYGKLVVMTKPLGRTPETPC
jgi:GNAT superfamily N-acetyltransferase